MECDSEKYWNASQCCAGFQIYQKNQNSKSFLTEYFYCCQNEKTITDLPNTCGLDNLPAFKDHRHDQSILSLLAEKNNIQRFRHPSQFGNKYKVPALRKEGEFVEHGSYAENYCTKSYYDTLLWHHRTVIGINKNL